MRRFVSFRRIFIFAIALLLVLAVIWGLRVGMVARSALAHLGPIEAMAQGRSKLDVMQARESLTGIRQDVAAMRAEVAWLLPLLPYLEETPGVGAELAMTPPLFALAESLLSAADMATTGWEPVLNLVNQKRESSLASEVGPALEKVTQNRAHFLQAKSALAQAVAQRHLIKEERLSERAQRLLQRVDQTLPLLKLAIEGGLVAPEMLGMEGARTYLVIAQNEDELRPTGGFISAVIRITIERGKITVLEFTDANVVDDLSTPYPEPPKPLKEYMLSDLWLFRDANWSPDFPTSARQLIAFYQQGRGHRAHGVIAVDQTLARMILEAVGPLTIEGKVVNSENLLEYMRGAWAPADDKPLDEWVMNRKNFIGQLASAMQARVADGQKINTGAVGRAVYKGLRERHLQIFVDQHTLSETLAVLNWDGALRESSADYLLVVDANLGFTKVNPYITSKFDYVVDVSPALEARAQLTMKYHHRGQAAGRVCKHQVIDYSAKTTYAALTDACYWDFVRVYTPSGSRLRSASRHPIASDVMLSGKATSGEAEELPYEEGKTVFANFFMLVWGAEQRVQFQYELPRGVIQALGNRQWRYQLYVQKQSGTQGTPLTVEVQLPPRAKVVSTEPAPISSTDMGLGTRLIFNQSLIVDQEINIVFEQP